MSSVVSLMLKTSLRTVINEPTKKRMYSMQQNGQNSG